MRELTEISHRIIVPTPYRVGPANVYAFDAGPVTLFDCGPNTPAAENALRLGLAERGLAFEQVARVVISHGHPDHYGLATTIQRASGATVYVGEPDVPKIRRKSLMEYMRTLDVLESLELTLVWTGHGEPIRDPAATIRQIKEHHVLRKEEVASRLDDRPVSPFEVARAMFRDLEGF